MSALTKKALTISIIAGILVLIDGIIVNLMGLNGSFVWVSFISWTVFFGVPLIERIKAIPGYIIGFLLAILIINFGSFLNDLFSIKILGVALSSILATAIVNFFCMYFEKLKKIYLDSISGIFVGIALTFSGLGIGLTTNTLDNSIMMLSIILIYGILGLLSGYITMKVTSK